MNNFRFESAVNEAIREAEEFIEIAKTLDVNDLRETVGPSPRRAAMKRQSMNLTRALAAIRTGKDRADR